MNTEPLSRIADGELQERIERFGRLMCEAEERYQQSKAVEDRAARDHAWISKKAHLLEQRRRAEGGGVA